MLLATISHPNRRPVFNLESWRFFFASSRLGVAPWVIHPIALRGTGAASYHSIANLRANDGLFGGKSGDTVPSAASAKPLGSRK
jgi:hypothetical protein